MTREEVLQYLKERANPDNVAGMARYGINPQNTLGVTMVALREVAKTIGKNHSLAIELWQSGIHEARILASLIDEPRLVTEEQAEAWVLDLDSWDVCDQLCSKLLDKTRFAWEKAKEWTKRDEEFVKRAGFVLIASLAVHDKKAEDTRFTAFFPLIRKGADDSRNFVKKAVNWALRQIGKRNPALNEKAVQLARELLTRETPSARWIARDALRELTGEKVQLRFAKRAGH
ncbi:MAG: DNA alkylation repair protein [Acidobacteriota bacterium]|nr:MAG: DNA alkylation repair protein [Acidobacteriota bacterium]